MGIVMRSFDFYEFTGLLAPGTVLLAGLLWQFAHDALAVRITGLSAGDLGVFLIIAYIVGHIVQSVGNGIECIWWHLWGGMPTDWVRTGRRNLLSDGQREMLSHRISSFAGIDTGSCLADFPEKQWHAVVRQIYAAVQQAGANARVDIQTGNYGLCRGVAAALFVLATTGLFAPSGVQATTQLLYLVGGAIALLRMHRFGLYYAQELFVQYLQTADKSGQKVVT